jgi:predicted PurR-regulated permease PerM
MNFDPHTLRLLRACAITTVVIVVMSVAAEVFKPLALAVLFSFILAPVVQWGQRQGLPRVISVALTLLIIFAVLSGVTYLVGGQFASLAEQVPTYQENIKRKLESLQTRGGSTMGNLVTAMETLEKSMQADDADYATPVRVVSESAAIARLHTFFGPFHIALAFGGIVLLLLVFILIETPDISDRIVQMVGWGKIGITTKTISQIGTVLSRYLATLAFFNIGFGIVIGLGLWGIGLPSPALWGLLAAILRFIPYLGTVISFSFPLLIAIAHFPGWVQPLLVVGLFALAELVANSIEPLVYGKSTGISPIGLLVTALIWTWMWGALGLLLANALTVCLAVIGRSIPGLGFLGILLQHEVEVADDLRWYQRVLNHDQDGATAILDDALKTRALDKVCDEIVIPTLARSEEDLHNQTITKRDIVFIWRVVRDWLDELDDREDYLLFSPESSGLNGQAGTGDVDRSEHHDDADEHTYVGIATNGVADALILRMLNLLLKPSGVQLTVLSAVGSPLRVSDKVEQLSASLILVSHLPPLGLTRTRYLIKRLRARYASTPLVVGYWNSKADPAQVTEQIRSASAYHVALSIGTARTMILERIHGSQTAVQTTS